MWILYAGGQPQWTILRHNGPFFPEPYQVKNLKVKYQNQELNVDDETEEKLYAFVKYLDTEYINNPKFKKNFWSTIKKSFPQNINLDDLDLSQFIKTYNNEKEKKANMSKEEKERIKQLNEEKENAYKIVRVDGGEQKVGNYKIEPPGIFLGRGSHPKIGLWKPRIKPEDVILNLDKEAPIPEPNISGKWGGIVHQRESVWLATWKDEITGKNKYVFPSVESFFKAKSDQEKFDLAKKLKNKVSEIRKTYENDLQSPDEKSRQLATALYFIDNLALRVGGKKDTKEEADTVGVTSLRVEHLTFNGDNVIRLDFLGKDSVRFCKLVPVSELVYKNLQEFVLNKNKKDDLFDKITSSTLNEYLKQFMKDLTAKVWRTFKASQIFQKEIDKIDLEKFKSQNDSDRLNYLLAMFNQANTQVALLCNHQKGISKTFDDQIDKIKDKLKELKKKKQKYEENKNKDKLNNVKSKIELLKTKIDTKEKMKNVSLGTSKTNYIDPRIIIAFAKKYQIPLEKIFTQALMKRFQWALEVDENYKF